MSDDDSAICPDCGDEFASEHGVQIHQNQSDCGNDAEDASEFDERVLERDDYECRRCDDDAAVVHKMDASKEDEGDVRNYRALCEECDEYVSGLNRFTKDSVIEDYESYRAENRRATW